MIRAQTSSREGLTATASVLSNSEANNAYVQLLGERRIEFFGWDDLGRLPPNQLERSAP
jgi:hypothetical protein